MHAFVHDRIFHLWGAEKVLINLIHEKLNISNNKEKSHEIYIFTLFSNKKYLTIDEKQIPIIIAMPRWINNIFVRWSWLKDREYTYLLIDEKAPKDGSKFQLFLFDLKTLFRFLFTKLLALGSKILSYLLDYRNLIVFYPLLTKLLANKILATQPKTVTISSFAAVKNIIPPGKIWDIPTTLYLHSPMQYIRENYEEYCKKLSRWQLIIFRPLATYFRKRDRKPRHYDYILTNSIYTKQCALKYYFNKTMGTAFLHFEPSKIHVQYPKLEQIFIDTPPSKAPKDYFLYVGRLVKFIRETDLIIKLCNEINIPLIVMGSWPDEKYLKEIAGDTITFIGQINDLDEKTEIIKNARGLLNLAKESCGISTMEALSLWVPVFGYKWGATPEFVNDTNGVLTENKDLEHLILKFQEFLKKENRFERKKIKENFLERIKH